MTETTQTPPYTVRSSPFLGDEYAGVRIDEAGNFVAKTHGDPRALAVLLRMIADEVEADHQLGEQWGGFEQREANRG